MKRYTLGEEIFNSVSHGVGAVLSVAALVLMTIVSVRIHSTICIVSSAIYGASLILMYMSSTMYHSLTNETAKKVFRILDHGSIFLLIAGTYTPYTLVAMKGPVGISLFCIIWALAVVGIVLNSISLKKFAVISVACYILMGWAIVFAMKPLMAAVEKTAIILLFIGGVIYTLGIIFYAMKKIKYMHSIWHLFVLAGSMFHFFSIFLYVLPLN